MNDKTEAQIEMPRYRSHKEVWALKIAGVEIHEDGSATIAPVDKRYAPLKTRAGWADRFEGSEDDLGYYVVYRGGFSSWSPTAEFENGYTAIENK